MRNLLSLDSPPHTSLERALFLLKLSRYFLSLVVRSLTLLYLCTDCLGFILFEVFLASCQIWKLFSHYFLKHFKPCPLSFWNSNDINIRYFVVIPQFPEALFIFFTNIFSLLFRLGVFICSLFNFSGSFLYSPHSVVELIYGIFFWVLYFQFKNFYFELRNQG